MRNTKVKRYDPDVDPYSSAINPCAFMFEYLHGDYVSYEDYQSLQTQLTEERKCSVCAGMGNPVSGSPCVCGGEGTVTAELHGLRTLLFESQEQVEKLKELIDIKNEQLVDYASNEKELVEALGKMIHRVSPDCMTGMANLKTRMRWYEGTRVVRLEAESVLAKHNGG